MTLAPLRAAGRIAWRAARRNPRRSVLVIAMVASPLFLVTGVATIARTSIPTTEDRVTAKMGQADLLATPKGRVDASTLERDLPQGSRIAIIRYDQVPVVASGSLFDVSLIESDVVATDELFDGLYEVVSGRPPQGPDEAAVHPDLLVALTASVGDTVEIGDRTLTVTGVARSPQNYGHHLAIVGRGTLSPDADVSAVLIDVPTGVGGRSISARLNSRFEVATDEEMARIFTRSDAALFETFAIVAGALGLFATGLIAAAAFVVGARRQLRDVGLVGAVGGERRHVLAVVLLGGTALGLVGSMVGASFGIVAGYLLQPILDDFLNRSVGPVEINYLVLFGAIAMGTGAATLAALAPARAAAKVSTVDALAGRSGVPRPPGRVAGVGLLIVAAGALITAAGTQSDHDLLLTGGPITILCGFLLSIPLLVALVGRIASRLPMTGRLAARDTARHGRRTGAAVAAAVIALAVPVAVSTYSLSAEAYERRSPRLGADQLLIGTGSDLPPASARAAVRYLQTEFPDALIVPLTRAAYPPTLGSQGVPATVYAEGALEGESPDDTAATWELFIANDELLRALHAEEGTDDLERGKALALGGFKPRGGYVHVDPPPDSNGEVSSPRVPAVSIDSPSYLNTSVPRIVVSRALANDLGLRPQSSGHLLTNASALSSEEIQRAKDVASDHPGVFIYTDEDYLPPYALTRAAVTAASLPLALAIVAVAVALVASESRRSRQILVAVGAEPLSHRKLLGATSALIALIAAVLAVPAGFVPLLVLWATAGQSGLPLVVPWATIGIVVFFVPLLAAIVSGVVARTPKLGSLLRPAT
jgi:putative ABC transport system permease protein